MLSDCHSPVYYLITRGFITIVGDAEFILRLPAALFGIATIPVIYFAAKECGSSDRASLLASLLFCLSPWSLWASQEARTYSMAVFAAALTLYLYLRCRRNPSPTNQYLLGASAGLVVLSHYLASVFVVVIVLDAIRTRNLWWRPVIPLTAMVIPVAYQIIGETQQYLGHKMFGYAGFEMAIRTLTSLSGLTIFIPVFGGMFTIGLIEIGRQNRSMEAFVASLVIVPLAALSIIGYFMQMMPRYAIAILVPWCIVLGAASDHRNKMFGASLAIVTVACSMFGAAMYYQSEPAYLWDDVAGAIRGGGYDTVCVIPSYEAVPLKYYLGEAVTVTENMTAADAVIVTPSEVFADWNRSELEKRYCIGYGCIDVCTD